MYFVVRTSFKSNFSYFFLSCVISLLLFMLMVYVVAIFESSNCSQKLFVLKGIFALHLCHIQGPGAQLVEHRAVTREVMSSTPAGPTLRVFK